MTLLYYVYTPKIKCLGHRFQNSDYILRLEWVSGYNYYGLIQV